MLKLKPIYSLGMLLISSLALLSPAFAGDSFISPYLFYHTVADSGLTEAKTTFDLTERPWLYIERSTAFDSDDINSIKWYSLSYPNGVKIYTSLDSITWNANSTAAWVAFDESYWYNTLTNKEGVWTIVANIGTDSNSAETSFTVTSSPTVTPEPVSSVLFLIGGAALFLRRRRGECYEA